MSGRRRVAAARTPGAPRAARAAAAALLLLAGACASVGRLVDGYRDASAARTPVDGDAWLRASLERGAFDSALVRLTSEGGAPNDELLGALYAGLVAHYGGRLAASTRALAAADALADDRYTKSLTRGALSLLTSDAVLPYASTRTDRLLVHYYGVLGYLAHDSAGAAAVEARRLSKLLERFREGRALEERATHAVMHYVAGVGFEAAGERTDAAVAYRNAAALAGGDGGVAAAVAATPTTVAPRRRGARERRATAESPTGEVVVVVEQGFVGRRVERSAVLGFDSIEVARLAAGESDSTLIAALEHRVAAGVGPPSHIEPPRPANHAWHDVLRHRAADAAPATRATPAVPPPPSDAAPSVPTASGRVGQASARSSYALRVSWPAFARPARSGSALQLRVARVAGTGTVGQGALRIPPRYEADLSDAAAIDFERQRPALVARSVARAAVRSWATRAAERRGGRFGGAMATAAASRLERADTRSWSLLPGTIRIARVSLAPGTHTLVADAPGAAGRSRPIELGTVTVRAGGVAVLSTRLWGDAAAR